MLPRYLTRRLLLLDDFSSALEPASKMFSTFYLPSLRQWLENGQWIFVKTLEDYCDRWVECLVYRCT